MLLTKSFTRMGVMWLLNFLGPAATSFMLLAAVNWLLLYALATPSSISPIVFVFLTTVFFVLAIFSFCGTPFAIEEKWLKPLRASSFPTVLWAACLIWLAVSFVVPAGVLLMSGINGAPPTENALATWIVHGWTPMFSAYAPLIIGFSQAIALRLIHTLFAPLAPNSKPTPQ